MGKCLQKNTVQREYKEFELRITLESSSTWEASPSRRCGLPSVLSRHSHLRRFQRLSLACARSEKGSGVSSLEKESAMCY